MKEAFKGVMLALGHTFMLMGCLLSFLFLFSLIGCSKQQNCKGDLNQYERIKDFNYIKYYDNFNNLTRDVTTGVHYVYFGKPNCPWCQQYLPYYLDYAKEYKQKILYFNPDSVKGTYEVEDSDGNIMLFVNDEYQKILSWILKSDKDLSKNYLQYNLFVMDSKGNPHTKLWLYVPKLFKVVNGKIVGAVATIEGHEKVKDSNGKFFLPELTAEQETILKNELRRLFERKED